MITVFFTSFIGILVAEFGDKSQIITLNLSSRYPPWQVLAGAMTGLGVVLAMATALGQIVYDYVPLETVVYFSGGLFIVIGIWTFFSREKNSQDNVKDMKRHGFFQSAVLLFFSELGDKTQIAAMLFTASFGMPLVVFAAAMTAMFINHALAVYLGARFLSMIPPLILKRISAAVFVVMGIFVIVFGS